MRLQQRANNGKQRAGTTTGSARASTTDSARLHNCFNNGFNTGRQQRRQRRGRPRDNRRDDRTRRHDSTNRRDCRRVERRARLRRRNRRGGRLRKRDRRRRRSATVAASTRPRASQPRRRTGPEAPPGIATAVWLIRVRATRRDRRYSARPGRVGPRQPHLVTCAETAPRPGPRAHRHHRRRHPDGADASSPQGALEMPVYYYITGHQSARLLRPDMMQHGSPERPEGGGSVPPRSLPRSRASRSHHRRRRLRCTATAL